MGNEYKKLFSPYYKCPICGKIDCKGYGSGKVSKGILRRKVRRKLKQLTHQHEDKGEYEGN